MHLTCAIHSHTIGERDAAYQKFSLFLKCFMLICFFAKDVSTLVVVFKLEQKYFISLKSSKYIVSMFSMIEWNGKVILFKEFFFPLN